MVVPRPWIKVGRATPAECIALALYLSDDSFFEPRSAV
jgi:hypothetical protein